jgi:hypothetical protein
VYPSCSVRLLRNPARTVILWTVLCAVAASYVVNRAVELEFWPGVGAWVAYGFAPILIIWVLATLLIIWLWRRH